MKTSAIHQRVADFLKEYPPFSYLKADALERLAGKGRVLYREKGDLVFEEGSTRGRFIYVIQQGGVRLTFHNGGKETLVDLRGVGEMLGADGTQPVYCYSAWAIEDTILYAIDAVDFHEECAANAKAARSLSLLLTADPGEAERDAAGKPVDWFQEHFSAKEIQISSLLKCVPGTRISDVARAMKDVEDAAMVVVDPEDRPIGICTNHDLRSRVATGEISPQAPVQELMQSPVYTISPEAAVGAGLIEMMQRGARHLCVTEDGTPGSRAIGMLSEHSLMLLYGNNPLTLLRGIQRTKDIDELAALRGRADVLLQRGMRTFADVDWHCEVMAEIDRAVIRRVIWFLDRQEGLGSGISVLLVGTAGRREKLVRNPVGLAAIVPDSTLEAQKRGEAFLARVQELLVRCGYQQGFGSPAERECFSANVWKENFLQWVSHPIDSDIHTRLALFDFDPLNPVCSMAADMRDVLAESIRRTPSFLALLVNDARAHMPPLTFFEGNAVDDEGRQLGALDLNDRVFWAVSDAMRVLAFEAGEIEVAPTLIRLARAGERFPEQKELFAEAAKAVRIVLFQRARNAFRTGGSGNLLLPSDLTRTDQALLKFSFRAISRLLDFVLHRYNLK